jgi:NADPH-dependent 2,4-dienoyl-CoA reductase/sulfur reductase-like enzyme
MHEYSYLIIGGGMTAAAAVKGIREVDPDVSIGLISAEAYPPYKRPPLTKKLWQGKPEDIIWLDLPKKNLHLQLNCRVARLNPREHSVLDESGQEIRYGRLLLATGGTPRRLPTADPEVVYFRTLDDYRTLRGWTGKGAHFGVIGGGFIGSELVAALASNGEQVTMVFPESGIGARVYPEDLSANITEYYRQKGVDVRPGTAIQAVEKLGGRLALKVKDGPDIPIDRAIVGLGIRPNTDLAQAAGIALAGPEASAGILVDEYLRTSQPDVFAAGDVASFFNPALDQHVRVEHEDNANTMGAVAGLNLAGRKTPYLHQPYFYSDLFELGYEAVGDLNSQLETVADWREPYRQGVIYYLKNRLVRGVLLWNTWGQVDAARELIASKKPYPKSELKGRIGG